MLFKSAAGAEGPTYFLTTAHHRDTACFRPNLTIFPHKPSVTTVCCEVPLPTADFGANCRLPQPAHVKEFGGPRAALSEAGPVRPDHRQTAQSLRHVTPPTPPHPPGHPAEALLTSSPAHLGSVKVRSTGLLIRRKEKTTKGPLVSANRSGVGCEGCYPDGACHTCAVYLAVLVVDSGTASHQTTRAALRRSPCLGISEGASSGTCSRSVAQVAGRRQAMR